jgi:hypothetical protein
VSSSGPALDYGRRLTDAEYQRRIVELHSAAHDGSDEADRELRRKELDLRIDYRLGCAFPGERRAALWNVQERIEKKRLGLAFGHLMRRMFHRLLVHDTRKLAQFTADEFAQVLSRQELIRFLDLRDADTPQLPIEREAKK